MKYEYDKEVDGLYVWFVNNIEEDKVNYRKDVWPDELEGEIGFLFDNKGKIMGLEIQPASKYFDEARLDQIARESY
jgi:uncharacterized protein YuzE